MRIDEEKLKRLTSEYDPVYELNKQTIMEFSKILTSIYYITDIPKGKWKSKVPFETVKAVAHGVLLLNRNSLTFPVIISGFKINKKFRIGSWIFNNLGIQYPNPIYQIFPPAFGKNHIRFIERMMAALNATGMCKKDWEFLLNFAENDVILPEDKKLFSELINHTYNSLYECYIAERYREVHIKPGVNK